MTKTKNGEHYNYMCAIGRRTYAIKAPKEYSPLFEGLAELRIAAQFHNSLNVERFLERESANTQENVCLILSDKGMLAKKYYEEVEKNGLVEAEFTIV